MACTIVFMSIFSIFWLFSSCSPLSIKTINSFNFQGYLNSTGLVTTTPKLQFQAGVGLQCFTGAGDWLIDPPTAWLMSQQYCQGLRLPKQGGNFTMPIYPTDLLHPNTVFSTTTVNVTNTNSTNTTKSSTVRATLPSQLAAEAQFLQELEASGIIMAFTFARNENQLAETPHGPVVQVRGSDAQCHQDDCGDLFNTVISTCKVNSQHLGGLDVGGTDCGEYWLAVKNCSGNIWDGACNRWLRQYGPGNKIHD